MKKCFGIVCATVLGAGCATQPFSYIDGRKWTKTDMYTYSVIVLSVDGRNWVQNPVPVEPGKRTIVVQGPPPEGMGAMASQERTLVLDVKPCVQYYLAAVKESPLVADFKVRVDYEQPIGGCNPDPSSKK